MSVPQLLQDGAERSPPFPLRAARGRGRAGAGDVALDDVRGHGNLAAAQEPVSGPVREHPLGFSSVHTTCRTQSWKASVAGGGELETRVERGAGVSRTRSGAPRNSGRPRTPSEPFRPVASYIRISAPPPTRGTGRRFKAPPCRSGRPMPPGRVGHAVGELALSTRRPRRA
jgi:hypothetical protein